MEATNGRSFVIFRLGEEQYGVPVESVNSIIRYEISTPVPHSPQSVMGVINLRGRVIPVVDLRHRFAGVAFEPSSQSRIVVAESGPDLVGLAVDSANEVTVLPVEAFQPVPEGVLSNDTAKAFTGVVERDESLIILLDLEEALPRGVGVTAVVAAEETEGETDV